MSPLSVLTIADIRTLWQRNAGSISDEPESSEAARLAIEEGIRTMEETARENAEQLGVSYVPTSAEDPVFQADVQALQQLDARMRLREFLLQELAAQNEDEAATDLLLSVENVYECATLYEHFVSLLAKGYGRERARKPLERISSEQSWDEPRFAMLLEIGRRSKDLRDIEEARELVDRLPTERILGRFSHFLQLWKVSRDDRDLKKARRIMAGYRATPAVYTDASVREAEATLSVESFLFAFREVRKFGKQDWDEATRLGQRLVAAVVGHAEGLPRLPDEPTIPRASVQRILEGPELRWRRFLHKRLTDAGFFRVR